MNHLHMWGLALSAMDSEMTKLASSSDAITQHSMSQTRVAKKLMACISIPKSLGWESATEACRHYNIRFSFF